MQGGGGGMGIGGDEGRGTGLLMDSGFITSYHGSQLMGR